MSDLQVVSSTQIIEVYSRTDVLQLLEQRIDIDLVTNQIAVVNTTQEVLFTQPGSSISVINAGPPGPTGPSSVSENAAQAAFQDAYGLEQKEIEYFNSLPSIVRYFKNSVLIYVSEINYDNGLPTLITIIKEPEGDVFQKQITYTNGLPTSVEWLVV